MKRLSLCSGSQPQKRHFLVSVTGNLYGFAGPNENELTYYNKSSVVFSEKEFRKLIKKQAKADAAQKQFCSSQSYQELRRCYISQASPDRRKLIRLAVKNWLSEESPAKSSRERTVSDPLGRIVATYGAEGWKFHLTPEELDFGVAFDDLYRKEYYTYESSRV